MSSSVIVTTIWENADKDSDTSRTIDGTPATGNKCFGLSFVVIGNKRLPLEDAKTTAQARSNVLKNGGAMVDWFVGFRPI